MIKIAFSVCVKQLPEPDGRDVGAWGRLTCTQTSAKVPSYRSKCFLPWEGSYAHCWKNKLKLQTTKCVSPACTALEARWSCSVMETSPSVCEVMCEESVQQYCGLCSIQIQQIIWEVAHSSRLQECELQLTCITQNWNQDRDTHTHTHLQTHVFAMNAVWHWAFYAIFNGIPAWMEAF